MKHKRIQTILFACLMAAVLSGCVIGAPKNTTPTETASPSPTAPPVTIVSGGNGLLLSVEHYKFPDSGITPSLTATPSEGAYAHSGADGRTYGCCQPDSYGRSYERSDKRTDADTDQGSNQGADQSAYAKAYGCSGDTDARSAVPDFGSADEHSDTGSGYVDTNADSDPCAVRNG